MGERGVDRREERSDAREPARAPAARQSARNGDPTGLLALQQSIGNRATRALLRRVPTREAPQRTPERQPAPPAVGGAQQQVQQQPPAQPRQDYVFIMGRDDGFYPLAVRYWRAHAPNARFVIDSAPPGRGSRLRAPAPNVTRTPMHDLATLLNWINANVTQPMGNVYIVSHANEDGTLSFGLDPTDRPPPRGQRQIPGRDAHLTVRELRDALHPAGGGASRLPTLNAGLVDADTTINIKGCDIGRTQGMVELIDEAFGGHGTVTAPTHEQVYGVDSVLGDRAVAAARAQVEARHPLPPPAPPEPPPVDRSLRGPARTRAQQERSRLVRERQLALRERQRLLRERDRQIAAELARIREVGQTYEALSGPLFQRTGTQRFTEAEARAEVDRLYGHLSEAQRQAMAQQLVANDPRRAAVAEQQGTYRQRGQRAYSYRVYTFTHSEPQTVAEVNRKYAGDLRANNFVVDSVRTTRDPATTGSGFTIRVVASGNVRRRGQPDRPGTRTYTSGGSVPDDAELERRAREQLNNPGRYSWRVERVRAANGDVTRTVIAERVVIYLHHGRLDPGPHQPFTRPLTDPEFYATSTFAPPPPPSQPRP